VGERSGAQATTSSLTRGRQAISARLQRLDAVTRDVLIYCSVFALLRFWAALGGPIRFPDSPEYLRLDFLGREIRLWTVPLIYKSLPGDDARVVAQIVLGIVCWSALALAIARSLRTPLVARIGAVLVLLIGLCVQVVAWDQTILSESIALSLTVLLIASCLWFRLRRSTAVLVGVLLVLTLWIFTRQLQAAVYIPLAIVAIIWILARGWRRRSFVVVACALAVLGVWGGYVDSKEKIIVRSNAYSLLVLRILKTSDGREFFASRGMPSINVLSNAAENGWKYGDGPVINTQDSEWSDWVDQHWKRTYARWLLGRPIEDLRAPLSHLPTNLAGDPNYGEPRGTLPWPVQDMLWETSPTDSGPVDLPLLIALALALQLMALRVGRPGSLDALGLGVVGGSLLWYLVGYHTHIGESIRILVPVGAAFRIGIVLVGLTALDRILWHRQALQRPESVQG
jgi:hypothetical protein